MQLVNFFKTFECVNQVDLYWEVGTSYAICYTMAISILYFKSTYRGILCGFNFLSYGHTSHHSAFGIMLIVNFLKIYGHTAET